MDLLKKIAKVEAQLPKALSWEAWVGHGFESHQNVNLLQIFLQNHTKMAGISNIIISWWPINFEEESYAILTLESARFFMGTS